MFGQERHNANAISQKLRGWQNNFSGLKSSLSKLKHINEFEKFSNLTNLANILVLKQYLTWPIFI